MRWSISAGTSTSTLQAGQTSDLVPMSQVMQVPVMARLAYYDITVLGLGGDQQW